MAESLSSLTPILEEFLAVAGKLPLARFEVEMEVQRAGSLPAWLGSALRGAFGHAFKQTRLYGGPRRVFHVSSSGSLSVYVCV